MSITIQKLYNLLFNNNQIGLSLRVNCDSFSKLFFMSGLLKCLSKAWRWAHNFLYYLWQVRVSACTTVHVQRGPGEPVTCPLLQFLHSILPRYNYSTSLPTCSSPCRSVRRPPAPRRPHMQIRRLPPLSHRQRRTVLPCLGGEGTWSLPSALCPHHLAERAFRLSTLAVPEECASSRAEGLLDQRTYGFSVFPLQMKCFSYRRTVFLCCVCVLHL